jgi:hypothetical protein
MDRAFLCKSKKNRKGNLHCKLHSKNRKGLSTIVVTLLLIVLSIAAVGLVWTFISSMVKGQIKNSEACYGNYEKIKINGEYTCYEQSGSNYYLRFAIGLADVRPEKLIVAISSAGETKSYTITNVTSTTTGLVRYPSNSTSVALPEKNGGFTYKTGAFAGPITSMKIAPVMNGVQCDVSDSITEFVNCILLV